LSIPGSLHTSHFTLRRSNIELLPKNPHTSHFAAQISNFSPKTHTLHTSPLEHRTSP
jgi:hypothetical protein